MLARVGKSGENGIVRTTYADLNGPGNVGGGFGHRAFNKLPAEG